MKTTKSIFILLCFFASTTFIQAQLGIKGGLNLSSLKYFTEEGSDSNYNEEYVTGYQVGAVYYLGIGDKLSLQPEAAYYTRGGKSSPSSNINSEHSYKFINLNALLNYNLIGNNDGLNVQLTFGAFAGYALDANVKNIIGGNGTDTKIDFGSSDSYQRSNLGYIVGAGLKVNDFIVSLRAAIGVADLGTFQSSLLSTKTTFRSREYSIVGAYLF